MEELYRIRWVRMWLWAFAILLLGIGGGWLLWHSAAPVTDGGVVVAVEAPAVKVKRLMDAGQFELGLHRVSVDGRTFLLWIQFRAAALVEYVPAEDRQKGGD